MNQYSSRLYRAVVMFLTAAAVVIPFKENIGQIFLLLAALAAPFLIHHCTSPEIKENSETSLPEENESSTQNYRGMLFSVIALIIAGIISTFEATDRIQPGSSLGLWKYPLALTLLMYNCHLMTVHKNRIMKALTISASATAFTIFIFAPEFWSMRLTNLFSHTFSGGSANVFPSIWAILGVTVFSFRFLSKSSKESPWGKTPYGTKLIPIFLILSVFIISAGRSRSALGIALTGIVLTALFRASAKLIISSAVIMLLVIGLVPRFRTMPRANSGSYYYRYITCRTAIAIATERPLLGCGPKKYRENFMRIYGKPLLGFNPRCANNFAFSVLAEQGLSGIFLFGSYLFFLVRELWKRSQNDIWSTSVLIAFLAYLAGGMVLDNRFMANQSGMVMVLLIALTGSCRRVQDAAPQ